MDYDVVIAGAGPAGCAAAYDLARAGKRVLLLDKRSFPRHKACACGLTRKTLRTLRYSVAPVIERECRDVVLQEAGPEFATGKRLADKAMEVRVRTREPFCAMAVRERFDAFCLQQTLAQGSQFRRIASIVALREMDSFVELDIALPGGELETLRTPVLIGADGSNGQTRRLAEGLQAKGQAEASSLPAEPGWYAHGFALEATVPFVELPDTLPAGDQPLDLVFDFAPIAGGYGWLFPKGDHINIGVGGFVPVDQHGISEGMAYETVSRALLDRYTRTKLGVALPAEVTGQYLGLGGHTYVPRGRVLLAGDAAGMVDPLTGEGIHSAVVSGQAAAAAIQMCGRENAASARLAETYAEKLRPLQEQLAFSHRAARAFYREPGRGFRMMRAPILRGLVLKTYADGLPHKRLIARLAKHVA